MFRFNLRDKVQDTVTGYTGTVTARAEYHGDISRYLVESVDTTGRPIQEWISEDRLVDDCVYL